MENLNSFSNLEKKQFDLYSIELTVNSYLTNPFGIYPEINVDRIKDDIEALKNYIGEVRSKNLLEKLIVVSIIKQSLEKWDKFWRKVLWKEKMSLIEIYNKLFDYSLETRRKLYNYLLEHPQGSVSTLISNFWLYLVKDIFYLWYLKLLSIFPEDDRFYKLTSLWEKMIKNFVVLTNKDREIKRKEDNKVEETIERKTSRFERLIKKLFWDR